MQIGLIPLLQKQKDQQVGIKFEHCAFYLMSCIIDICIMDAYNRIEKVKVKFLPVLAGHERSLLLQSMLALAQT